MSANLVRVGWDFTGGGSDCSVVTFDWNSGSGDDDLLIRISSDFRNDGGIALPACYRGIQNMTCPIHLPADWQTILKQRFDGVAFSNRFGGWLPGLNSDAYRFVFAAEVTKTWVLKSLIEDASSVDPTLARESRRNATCRGGVRYAVSRSDCRGVRVNRTVWRRSFDHVHSTAANLDNQTGLQDLPSMSTRCRTRPETSQPFRG